MSFSSDNAAITDQLPNTINLPSLDDKKLFVERLELALKQITDTVNQKDGGLYTQNETASSQQYYTKGDPQSFRNVYRKTFDFVSLSGNDIQSGDTLSFPHSFNSLKGSAGIMAHCATNSGIFFTAVYPDVWLDDENVNFVNPTTETLNQCDIVANILKE